MASDPRRSRALLAGRSRSMTEVRLKRQISEPQPETAGNDDQLISALLLSVIEEVRSAMSANAAIVAVCDSQGVRCVASTADEETVALRFHPNSAFTRECLETGKVVLCEDAENDSRIERSVVRSLHLRSAVAVPIQVQDSIVGLIEVFSSRPIHAADVTPLQGVANFLAPILAPESMRSAQPVVSSNTVLGQVEANSNEQVRPQSVFSNPEWAGDPSQVEGRTASAVEPGDEVSRVSDLREALDCSDSASSRFPWRARTTTSARAWCVGGALIFLSLVALALVFPRFPSKPIEKSSDTGVPAASREAKRKDPAIGPVGSKTQPTAEAQGSKDANRSSPVGTPLSSAVPRLPKAGEGKEEPGAADSPSLRPVPQEQGETSSFSAQRVDRRAMAVQDSKPPEAAHNDEVVSNPAPPSLIEGTKPETFEPMNAAEALVAVAPASRPIKSSPDFVLDRTVKGHSSWVTGVAFSPDNRRLASGSWDETVKVWDVPTGQQLSALSGKVKEVQALAFSSDGRWLATENSSDTVTLWDAATGKVVRMLPSDKPVGALGTNWVYSIAFSPDGRWLASGIDSKTVRIWEVSTGRAVRDLTALRRSVIYVAFSPDGRLLASGDDDKTIGIWDVSTGKEIQKLSGHRKTIYAAAFSPNGRWLASASADKTVRLWAIPAGREVYTLMGHKNIVTSLSFSPDSRWLASGSWDKTIKIWDVETGHEAQSLAAESHPIYSVAFDSCGRWLASGSEEGTINLWRLSGTVDCSRSR